MVLVPGELMSLHPQVLSSFVPHGELNPEYRLVFRADRPIVVDPGKPHGVLLVAKSIIVGFRRANMDQHKAETGSLCSTN